MKAFVITITDNPKSVEMSNRCIESFKRHNPDREIEVFDAITPEKEAFSLAEYYKIPLKLFQEKYSRYDRCVAAFMSHYTLWRKCIVTNKPIIVFEHDAVVTDVIRNIPFNGLVNLGAPSYGKFNTPNLGLGKLTSKRYLPGAHAYAINPKGAEVICESAIMNAGPTDVFLNNQLFPWIEEYYPWPAKADDSFSTIQNRVGCIAKHNFGNGDNYEII